MLSQRHATSRSDWESAWWTANTDSPPVVQLSRREGEHGGARGRVVRGLRGEHGHEDGEETIHDAPERPAVTVTAPAEELVMLAAVLVVPHADEAPIVERVSEARIAGIAHADEETFATLARDGRDAGLSAQPVIISGGQEPRGLGQHRGGDDSPDAWQGPEDRHVTMPPDAPRGGQGVQQALDAPRAVAALTVDEFETWNEQRHVGARRPGARGAPEPSTPGGARHGEGEPHERPKPPFVGGGTEGERLRIKPVELLAQPTGEAPPLLAQLILHPRPLPKLNDQRILGRERPEGRLVGREGGGQYERIPTIIFRPPDRRP